MSKYNQMYNPNVTPQNKPIPGSKQTQNQAGGYTWKLDKWKQLDRFLILGTTSATYYQSAQELTTQNVDAVRACIAEDGQRVVNRVIEVSTQGLAAKNDPALFVLALCASFGDDQTKASALVSLSQVARTGTHLFQFVEYVTTYRGWGRGLRRAIGKWYTDKATEKLAYQLVKYRQRNGWSHRDLMRLAHPTPANEEQNMLFKWAVDGTWFVENTTDNLKLIDGFEQIQAVKSTRPDGSTASAAAMIKSYRLPREAVPTELLTEPEIWQALLDVDMPMTALIRNLGNLSKVGLLRPGKWDVIEKVTETLTSEDHLKKARVHPIQILAALITYKQGHGSRGHGEWQVVPQVVDALNTAFHLSFKHVEPTDKRYMLGIDVSGSMGYGDVSGIPGMTASMAAAALAMTLMRTEPRTYAFGFATQFVDLGITPQMSLQDVMRQTGSLTFGATDCAQPMLYAMRNKLDVDVFVILTDNETWAGNIHPAQALRQYRQQTGINAKLAVMSMTPGADSVADPDDAGQMDFVGFSSDTPAALSAFVNL